MYGLRYKNDEYCPSVSGGKAPRSMFGLARDDNMNRSTFEGWNDKHGYKGHSSGLKGGQVYLRGGYRDDEPRHKFEKSPFAACSITAGSKRGNIKQPNSRSSNLGRKMIIQDYQLNEFADTRKCGSEPECKDSRCESNDPYYALPFYACNERKDKVHATKYGRRVPSTISKSRHSNMATVKIKLNTHTNDRKTEFTKFRDWQESRISKVFPMIKRNSDRERNVCLVAPHEDMKKPPTINSIRKSADPCGFTSKSLNTETIASTTMRKFSRGSEKHDTPERFLNNGNSNSAPQLSQKQTPAIPATKTHPSNPNSSLSLLRASKPSRSIAKIAREMIADALNEARLLNPKPKQKAPPHQHSENPTRPPKASQGETAPHKMHWDRNNWTASELYPLMHKLPATTQTPDVHQPEGMLLQPELKPQEQSQPPEQALLQLQHSETLVQTVPNRDSRGEVCDAATSVSSKSSSAMPSLCLCKLCGKSERIFWQPRKTDPKHNPLLNLANSAHSPSHVQLGTIPNCSASKIRFLSMEIVVLIAVGGILTLGLVTIADSLFRAYVAGVCRCRGQGEAGPGGVRPWPQVTADGLKSGVVNWVTCHMNEGVL